MVAEAFCYAWRVRGKWGADLKDSPWFIVHEFGLEVREQQAGFEFICSSSCPSMANKKRI